MPFVYHALEITIVARRYLPVTYVPILRHSRGKEKNLMEERSFVFLFCAGHTDISVSSKLRTTMNEPSEAQAMFWTNASHPNGFVLIHIPRPLSE